MLTSRFLVAISTLGFLITLCESNASSLSSLEHEFIVAIDAHQKRITSMAPAYQSHHKALSQEALDIQILLSSLRAQEKELQQFSEVYTCFIQLLHSFDRVRGPLQPSHLRKLQRSNVRLEGAVDATRRMLGIALNADQRFLLNKIGVLCNKLTVFTHNNDQNNFWNFSGDDLLFDLIADRPIEFVGKNCPRVALGLAAVCAVLGIYLGMQERENGSSWLGIGKRKYWNGSRNACFILATMFAAAPILANKKLEDINSPDGKRAMAALQAILDTECKDRLAVFGKFETNSLRRKLFGQGRETSQEDADEFFAKLRMLLGIDGGQADDFSFDIKNRLYCREGGGHAISEKHDPLSVLHINIPENEHYFGPPMVLIKGKIKTLKTITTSTSPHFSYVQDRIDHLLNQEETIEDFYCDQCNKNVAITKQVALGSYPDNFFITNKLFHYDFDKQIRVKLYNFIMPNLNLVLDHQPYHLRSIVLHTGSAGGGHYIAVVRDDRTNQWIEYNDGWSTPLCSADSEQELQEALLEKYNSSEFTPYCMFYQRVTH